MGRGRFCNYKFCKGLNFTRALSTPTVVSIAFTSLNMTMSNTTVFYNYQIRELTKVRRPRRAQRRLKLNSYFTNLATLKSSTLFITVKTIAKLNPEFLVFTHVTFALTTVAIRHVGAQTTAFNREITVRK